MRAINNGAAPSLWTSKTISTNNLNSPPVISAGGSPSNDEGNWLVTSGSFSDPDVGDSVSVTKVSGPGTIIGGGGTSGTWSWSYFGPDGPESGSVVVKATDSLGAFSTTSFTYTVNNVPPQVSAQSTTPIIDNGISYIEVGTAFTGNGSFVDPGIESWTGTVNWGDGGGFEPLSLGGKNFTLNHTYPQPGEFTITVRVDDGNAQGTATLNVTAVRVDQLIVSDDAHSTRIATNPGKATATELYIGETAAGNAVIDLDASGMPDNPQTGRHVLWQIEGAHSAPNPGDFESNDTVTLTPHVSNGENKFIVRAGFDDDGDGQLDHDAEVSHEITVYVVHIDDMFVWDVANPANIVTAHDPTAVNLFVAETDATGDATIKIDVTGKPQTPEAGQHVLWNVAGANNNQPVDPADRDFGALDPEVTLTPANGNRTFVVTLGFDDNGNQTLDGTEVNRTVNVYVIRIDVSDVTFSGWDANSFFNIYKDDGSGVYTSTGPHWQDNSSPKDRDADDPGDIRYPVAYKRASTMKLDTNFQIELPAGVSATGDIVVRGDGPAGYDFYGRLGDTSDPNSTVTLNGNTITLTDLAAEQFKTWIDHFDTFDITWEVSFDGGTRWVQAGTTKNQVYVLLDEPTTMLYHTVAHIATKNAKGEQAVGNVIAGVWSEFTDNSVTRIDGVQMRYNHEMDTTLTAAGMLAHSLGKGQCTAWADLLVLALGAHGIGATSTRIDPPGGFGNSFAVRAMPAQGSGGANYIPGTFATGGFNFHQVVRIGVYVDRIYDPSYGGLTIKTDARSVELKYEDENITHFYDSATNVWFADTKGSSELTFTP